MSNYSRIVDYASKDALTTGNPAKALKGGELGPEFDAIATMSATKEDSANKNIASGYTGQNASNQSQALGFVPTGAAVPVNGIYLPSANVLGFATNTTARGSISAAGSWIVATPTAGNIPFQIQTGTTGGATVPGLSITAAAANTAMLSLAGNATAIGTADFQIYQDSTSRTYLVNRANADLNVYTNTVLRGTFLAAGGLLLAAPTSGQALKLTGVANTNSAYFIAPTTSGQSFGLRQDAGTTSADYNLIGFNASGIELYRVQGDGVFKLQSAGYTPTSTLAFANPPTIVFANGNVYNMTMTGNISSAGWTLTGPLDGQSFVIFIKQDATGNRTIVWPASFTFPGGVNPALSTAANAKDMLVATYNAATTTYYCSLSTGFA